ncbi:MAG TPA: hybrid sensor histidine kinase/response regulator [Rhodospirillaceae bacterium]|nr:hybrid sensor histidine kinase/response regulator [Rhodospirillaceae bacterium]
MTETRELCIGQLLPRVTAEALRRSGRSGPSVRLVACGAWVLCDPARLERTVRLGLDNAMEHACDGRVVIGCRRHGDWLAIEIWSAGGGAALAWHQAIGSGKAGGCPGLPVLAEETAGGASRFAVLAPLAPPAPAGAAAATAVVVIDDEEIVLDSFRMLLETWQFDVVAAASAGDAIALLNRRRSRPAVIVADFRLRDGNDGISAVSRLRGLFGRAIPAILVTADPAATRASAAWRAANLAVVEKPVAAAHLRRLLARLLTVSSQF